MTDDELVAEHRNRAAIHLDMAARHNGIADSLEAEMVKRPARAAGVGSGKPKKSKVAKGPRTAVPLKGSRAEKLAPLVSQAKALLAKGEWTDTALGGALKVSPYLAKKIRGMVSA